MFLRKLLVIVVPLVLCGLCVFFLPLLGGFGLWSDLLQGLILGALLALLLPLSGASRRKEPFATLLVVPMIALIVLLALQLMRALGVALPFQPVSGCTMMIECTFLSFMTVQAIRTKPDRRSIPSGRESNSLFLPLFWFFTESWGKQTRA